MITSCTPYSLSESLNFDKLADFCVSNFKSHIYREVISVQFQDQEFHIFEFGVVVAWGDMSLNPELFFSQIKKFFIDPKEEKIFDIFKVSILENGEEGYKIRRDHLQLDKNDPLQRLAISFAMAQSVKLGEMELYVSDVLSVHSSIPVELAKSGNLKLSRKEMAKIRGRIFVTESHINLKYDLLDKPEFLWDHPEYDDVYSQSYDYLEVGQRINVLSKKLHVLRDILNILAEELQNKHSSKLELIIIYLIAIEIIMSISGYIFGK